MMRKIKYLLFLLLVSLLLIPTVFAEVKITNIELDSKSDGAIINSEPSFSGLDANYNVAFKEVGDFVKYKITVNNDSDIDYKVSEDTSFNDSDYITYEYSADAELKANGSLDVFLTITYDKEIDKSNFFDGKYVENNTATIKLLNVETEEAYSVVNPNTSSFYLMYAVTAVSIISIIVLIVLLTNKKNCVKYISLLIMTSILVLPTIGKAVEELVLKANTNIEILETFEVVYYPYKRVLLTPAEYENFPFKESCDNYFYYLNTVSEEKKRYFCTGYEEIKDEKRYTPGEEVVVKRVEYKNINVSYDWNNGWYIVTNVAEYDKNYSNWYYRKDIIQILGYTYNEDDDDIMFANNNSVSNGWDEDGNIRDIRQNDTFIMPNHDVVLWGPQHIIT